MSARDINFEGLEELTPPYGSTIGTKRLVWIHDGATMYLKLMWEFELLPDGTCSVEGKSLAWLPAPEFT